MMSQISKYFVAQRVVKTCQVESLAALEYNVVHLITRPEQVLLKSTVSSCRTFKMALTTVLFLYLFWLIKLHLIVRVAFLVLQKRLTGTARCSL